MMEEAVTTPHKYPPTSPELADARGKRIGILIVAYNAATTLAKVFRRIPDVVWKNVEEVVVFDDASQDETFELALGYKQLNPNSKLQIFKNTKNQGYGGNQILGYQYFMDRGFDIVVLLHGDGQYAPEILAHIYHPLVTGQADAVFGSRMMKEFGGPLKGGMPLYKYTGNKILTFLENNALNLNLTEFHSGYRAYDLHALRCIDFSRMTHAFHFDTEIIIKLQHQRFRIHEVPIPTYYGDEICYVNGMRYAQDVVKAVYRYRSCINGAHAYPEFAEYFHHYALKDSPYSSHYYAERLAGSNQKLLDIGCGEGFFAEQLHSNGNEVTGIDGLESPIHASAMRDYFQADLQLGLSQVAAQLSGRSYDKVLLLDVLEHLNHPERVLRDVLPLLRPSGGSIIVSLPNVANIFVRLNLLFGRFEYADRGILDRTHVRFYTRKTAIELLESNGYRITAERYSIIPLDRGLRVKPRGFIDRIGSAILKTFTSLFPTLFGYQLMFEAKPAGVTLAPAAPVSIGALKPSASPSPTLRST
ncbi:MAG TPA: glycosyltransferase [Bryobacteraceae bacterium]|nr:glycosyltransferase [Bryobacteraceae bacterium]